VHLPPTPTPLTIAEFAMHPPPEVKRQRNAKRMKVEIARELGEKKAAEKTIERTFFRKLYDSKYCMKGDPKVVAQTLKKLNSESAKRDALKNNIYIRTK
jgi:hypothetical protein